MTRSTNWFCTICGSLCSRMTICSAVVFPPPPHIMLWNKSSFSKHSTSPLDPFQFQIFQKSFFKQIIIYVFKRQPLPHRKFSILKHDTRKIDHNISYWSTILGNVSNDFYKSLRSLINKTCVYTKEMKYLIAYKI